MDAPFPYFGGKASVADRVWTRLGDVRHYIEPFFGSGAVLLNRPAEHEGKIETVCDADGYVANVWRAIQHAPDEVARWCDWPVNHADLSARKRRLIANEARLLENLIADDEWYDSKLAGYWVWAASCWIGSGLTRLGQRPEISCGGMGVHKLGQRPHIGSRGMGVHRLGQIPEIAENSDVTRPDDVYNHNIYAWMRRLCERLRYVRVVCGDWSRVCGGNWQDNMGVCGIFFDPPYGVADRDDKIYHKESLTVAADVAEWCAERGGNPRYRIVLAGYEEHAELITEHGWSSEAWKAKGGYGNIARNDDSERKGMNNRVREVLYYSPHCLEKPDVLVAHEQAMLY